jgi:protein-disulfide isomerase
MRTHLSIWAALSIAPCLAQPPSAQLPKAAPVAIVEGRPVLEEELSPLVESDLRKLRLQEYLVRHKALETLITKKLIAAKAEEKGLTTEEFLRQAVDGKLAEPTDRELESYYANQRNLSNVPFEQVKSRLVPLVKQQNAVRARQDYILRLREEAHVTVMLEPPQVSVSYDPARVRGEPSAPVTIIEFSDFQCPYCRKAHATLKELLSKYEGRVRLAYRDFPLSQVHPQAHRAAEAARCAGEQGKFWAYHDLLFDSPARWSDEDFSKAARTVGLDVPQFQACLSGGKFRSQVDEDLKEGTLAGVDATPGFFINGTFLSGSQPLATFEEIVDAELAQARKPAN